MNRYRLKDDIDSYEKWRAIRLAIIFGFVLAVIAIFSNNNSNYGYISGMAPLYTINIGWIYVWNIVGILFGVLLIMWIISWFLRPHGRDYHAERVLKERYAMGEISYRTYVDMLNKLRK